MKRLFRKLRTLLSIDSLLQNQIKKIESSIREESCVSVRRMLYNQRKEYLTQMAFKCTESGVSSNKYCDYELVVSMATHGERFYEAYLAIESIMQQTLKPNRIILNVAKNEFEGEPIPVSLKCQQKRGLEINYCEDYWSFKKIIPTLRRFPEAVIVTVDDDCLYNMDMLENMFMSYLLDPKAIWGNRIHDITFDSKSGNINSYMDWNMTIPYTNESSNLHFITSVGGVLYPPHSLYKDVLRDDIFMALCKTNDDIWCYVMAILAGTPIKKVRTHSSQGNEFLTIEEVQQYGLFNVNTNWGSHHCHNDEIIKRVFEKYDIYRRITPQ